MNLRPLLPAVLVLPCALALAGEPADAVVAQTLGVTGVTHAQAKSRYNKNANDFDYKGPDGKTLVTVRLGTPQEYDTWKQVAGADAEPIAGLGGDAFRYKTLKAVCARGAASATCVTPNFMLEQPKISTEQLKAVAKAAL